MDISEEANSYDAAFLIEAMCHAPNKTRAFSEVYQILRPDICRAPAGALQIS